MCTKWLSAKQPAGPSGRAVCGRSPAEIVGSNPTGVMDDVGLLWGLYFVR